MSSFDSRRNSSNSSRMASPSCVKGTPTVRPELLERGRHTATVTDICIYQTPMKNMNKQGGFLGQLHHHLMVTVNLVPPGGGQPEEGLRIKAEKGVNVDGSNNQISVKLVKQVEQVNYERTVRCSTPGLRAQIRMSDLLELLKKHDPNYSLVADNCWKYAHDTYISLLKKLGDIYRDDGDFTSADYIDGQLQKTPPLIMPDTILRGLMVVAATLGGSGAAGVLF